MIFKKPKKLFASLVLVLAFLTLYAVLSSNVSSAKKQIFIYPRSGPFVVSINVTGQLEAKNSTSILAPEELSKAEIWEIKIDQIVDEGTIVKKGDFVALLDRSNVLAKISEQEREIDKILNQKIQYEIDTAIQLDKFRDGISDLKFEIEQKEVLLNQSLYEPPATIEQLKMNLQKAEQDHTRALKAYDLQLKKLTAEFQKIRLALTSAHERLSSLRGTGRGHGDI